MKATQRRGASAVLSHMRPSVSDELDSKLIIQGIHLDLSEAMRAVIREKFGVLLRHNEYIVRINLRLHRDQTLGTDHHYSATAQIEIGGPDLVASADGKEAYDVLDELVEKLDRQLKSRQDRRKDKRNHPHPTEFKANLPKTQ